MQRLYRGGMITEKVLDLACWMSGCIPTHYDYVDPKTGIRASKNVEWIPWGTGSWKTDIESIDADVRITYKYRNRTYKCVRRRGSILPWPPVEASSRWFGHGAVPDQKGIVMALLISKESGVVDVTEDLMQFLGPRLDFHGSIMTAESMFPSVRQGGMLCVSTFDRAGLVFPPSKPVIL
jgi:hypothetical protein